MHSNRFQKQYEDQLRRFTDYKQDVKYFSFLVKISTYGGILFIFLIIFMSNLNITPRTDYPTYSLEWLLINVSTFLFIFAPIIFFPSRYIVKKKKMKHNYDELKIEFIYMYDALKSYEEWEEKKIERDKEKSLKCIKQSYSVIEKWNYDNSPFYTKEIKDKMNLIQYNLKTLLTNRIKYAIDDSQISDTIHILDRLCTFLYCNSFDTFEGLYNFLSNYKVDLKIKDYEYQINRIKQYISKHKNITYVILVLLGVFLYYVITGYMGIPHIERIKQISNSLVFIVFLELARRLIYKQE